MEDWKKYWKMKQNVEKWTKNWKMNKKLKNEQKIEKWKKCWRIIMKKNILNNNKKDMWKNEKVDKKCWKM